MKILFILTTSLIIVSLFYQSSWADDLSKSSWGLITNDFQMSINLSSGKEIITNGQPFIILAHYRNVSTNETFWIHEMEPDPESSFIVISPSGKDVSPDMGKVLYGDAAQNFQVHPTQSIEISYNLSKLIKFNENGTYKIVEEKKGVWAVGKKKMFKVVSNQLYVTVVPAK